ncbi:MAG TPA: hypothetical protein VFZ09_15045 [Archangium sp.]|uniref:hypothetical protein n=1 Tax=Archangium sp. TaxID=1872627 RepID=UPI002E32380B|nr:hypothetical protein [Archangium sp.]HEX5747561.1 hypothetical protein [Archangium sp.]
MAVDVEQFRKERIYRAQAPCTQVSEELQHLGDLDRVHEKKELRTHSVGVLSMIGSLPVGFIGLAMSDEESGPSLLLWMGVLMFFGGLVSFLMSKRYKRLNLENRRYELASRVVGLLRADMAPEEPVTLELDLREDSHPDKYQNESRTPSGWKVRHYLDPWLSLQARLLDGTHLRLEMTERLQLRSRTKTNARGKTKYQNKRLSDAFLRVRLRVKPERYQHLGRIGSRAQGAVQVMTGTQLEDLTVEADRVDMTLYLGNPWSAGNEPRPNPETRSTGPTPLNGQRVVATALLSLYQILNLSRALDKKAVHSRAG